MELLEWLHLLNALGLNQNHLSLVVANSLFIGYLLVYTLTKNAAPVVAFFMCVMLVDNSHLKSIDEVYMYFIVCVIYSYILGICRTSKQVFYCAIIAFISMVFAVDSFFYGVDGYYGASETVIYNNIEYISLLAHSFFINSFICYRKIRNGLRGFFVSFVGV